ncbi:hypothetical protein CPB85DRAFT_1335779, partial [Mucidula mucida]
MNGGQYTANGRYRRRSTGQKSATQGAVLRSNTTACASSSHVVGSRSTVHGSLCIGGYKSPCRIPCNSHPSAPRAI